ncbi:MAG: hypothetical protein LBH98_06810 [Chitinispirillales bacterium]|jgi:hypothetical protein|nr:hypothetical protein [Chitinispirillales bacterium]
MIKILKLMTVIPATLISMFLQGCGSDTETNSQRRHETDGEKEMFEVWTDKNDDGTFVIGFENNYLYPVPKFLINGVEANRFNNVNIVPAGNVIYSIIWDGDTLTRTINLPNNTYELARDTLATGYNYYIIGCDGDEKVEWCNLPDSWIVFSDILPVREKFFVPFTNGYGDVFGVVRPKNYKQITSGYFATAESEKIAVYERIELWSFFSNNFNW